ncbi:unnamed protein product [Penicillium salamii]|uniref:Uncharacterized protein n=1 Tax=Penicillium salamii TaxID=1612424 RepID=A0A9W4I468_9EURO|nr:unnamed protein product [Penicillium salamii]CAG8317677.1 unnamed protein product [Penicillium salamii]
MPPTPGSDPWMYLSITSPSGCIFQNWRSIQNLGILGAPEGSFKGILKY